ARNRDGRASWAPNAWGGDASDCNRGGPGQCGVTVTGDVGNHNSATEVAKKRSSDSLFGLEPVAEQLTALVAELGLEVVVAPGVLLDLVGVERPVDEER